MKFPSKTRQNRVSTSTKINRGQHRLGNFASQFGVDGSTIDTCKSTVLEQTNVRQTESRRSKSCSKPFGRLTVAVDARVSLASLRSRSRSRGQTRRQDIRMWRMPIQCRSTALASCWLRALLPLACWRRWLAPAEVAGSLAGEQSYPAALYAPC